MNDKEIKAKISEMLGRFDALTADDKAEIKEMCKEAGISASFKSRCKNCYTDALMLLKVHYGVSLTSTDIITPSGNFVYHNGLKKVVWWYKHHYRELSAQSDDETITLYMAVHPLQTHFSRVEPEPVEETEGDGTTEPNGTENGSEGHNIGTNEGDNGEGANLTEGDGNEEN